MFFSKSLLASVVVGASLALQASAHAIVMPALGVSGTPVRNDVERPSAAKPCGKVDIASTLGATQAITANADGSFQVQGNASFKDLSNALTRSCDVQHNQCANAANASGNKGDLTVDACGTQQTQCDAAH